jgi:uncharacterized protein YkwD
MDPMRYFRAAALAAGLTSLGTTTPAVVEAAPQQDAVEQSVIHKLNAIRAQHGLRALRASAGLARAADHQSRTVARTGSLSHGAMSSRVRRFVRAKSVGETLAFVPASRGGSATTVIRAWMRSPAHRATLLSARFRRIGVARRPGRMGGQRSMVFTVDVAS